MRNYFLMSLILVVGAVKANNISVSNVTLAGQNVSAGVNNAANFTYIEFDLTWDNSWRTSSAPNNWDAAWVFVKYRTTGSSTWSHVKLAPNGHNSSSTTPTTSYSVQVGLMDESVAHNATTNPAVGAFIYRSGNGTGTFSANDIRLKWFYRDNGVGDNDIIDVEVYAIEMVYVPDGSFTVGDNGNSGGTGSAAAVSQFYKFVSGANTGYEISSENSLSIQGYGTNNHNVLTADNANGGNVGTISASFPKGYKGFYCMKYECSQQQYVDFLNSLNSTQQANRAPTYNAPGSIRQMISASSGVYSTTLPGVPVNYITWMDLAAYMDWAGLRPMTELEYEKAARGTGTPVTAEYAWGNTTTTAHTNTLTNAGASNEVSATSGANIAYHGAGSSAGPIRVGAFANSSTSRSSAGASYYGIMELSGNLVEQVAHVTAGLTSFSGYHGNGELTAAGHGDVSSWPGLTSGAVTGATGAGVRGGSFASDYIHRCKISDRQNAYTPSSAEDAYAGIRGVHTKPITASETK